MKTTFIILLSALMVMAVDPNYVRSTVYQVGKDGSGNATDLISTSYSDGLGRQIQSKLMIDDTHDRTACTFYDDAGRPAFATKAFVDVTNPGMYQPWSLNELIDNDPAGPLWTQYNDANPYSYTIYSDDPLGRVIEQNGPGEDFTSNPVKTWYFGIPATGDDDDDDVALGINGFIKSAYLTDPKLNGVNSDGSDVVGSVPDYLATLNISLPSPRILMAYTLRRSRIRWAKPLQLGLQPQAAKLLLNILSIFLAILLEKYHPLMMMLKSIIPIIPTMR
jgi:hypothetical protein